MCACVRPAASTRPLRPPPPPCALTALGPPPRRVPPSFRARSAAEAAVSVRACAFDCGGVCVRACVFVCVCVGGAGRGGGGIGGQQSFGNIRFRYMKLSFHPAACFLGRVATDQYEARQPRSPHPPTPPKRPPSLLWWLVCRHGPVRGARLPSPPPSPRRPLPSGPTSVTMWYVCLRARARVRARAHEFTLRSVAPPRPSVSFSSAGPRGARAGP